jgi:hypothetical protein
MTEQQLIKAAYEDSIKKLYANYEDLWTQAMQTNDTAGVKKAEQIFSNGVRLRQQARDRALILLPSLKSKS